MQITLLYLQYVETFGSEHNFIGFDPRGVGHTGPSLSCFPNHPSAAMTLNGLLREPVFDQSPETGINQYYFAEAFGQWCNQAIGGPNGTAKYASTPTVARDMLTFIEAQNVANAQSPDDAELWYVGYSYGTLLGATFAALYSDRIGRMILDGVVDSEDYYKGQRANNLVSADNVVEVFFDTCYQAGPDNCSFFADSPAAIANGLQDLMENLRAAPVPVSNPTITTIPRPATYSTFKQFFFQMLYDPIAQYPSAANSGWSGLALVLNELEQRNATMLMRYTPGLIYNCPSSNQTTTPPYDELEANWMIGCMDAYGKDEFSTFDEYSNYAVGLENQSH